MSKDTRPTGGPEEIEKDEPRFDLEELSWGDTLTMTEAGAMLEAGPRANMQAVLDKIAEATEIIARVAVYVPRDWFVRRAPENLDLSDPATYRYLKRDRFLAVFRAMNAAQRPEAASGN